MRASLLVILLAGCAGAGPAAHQDLAGTEWVLATIRGQAPLGKSRITLRFEEKSAGGYAGCNWYGGGYEAAGGELKWGEMSSTLRGCLDSALTDQERSYLEALNAAAQYSIEGDRLVLSGKSGAPLLTLARRKALPMNPEKLVGTAWRLESIGGLPPAGSAPLTISFPEAGTMRGFAGCRDFVSRYQATGDRIAVTETHMDGTECSAPPAIAVQEGDFTTHLSEAEHFALTGDRLAMTTAGGVVLVFRRTERRS